jgi:hypothetical protein
MTHQKERNDMAVTRRTFNRGALSLLTAIASTPAIAQSQEEGQMLSITPYKIQISDEAIGHGVSPSSSSRS